MLKNSQHQMWTTKYFTAKEKVVPKNNPNENKMNTFFIFKSSVDAVRRGPSCGLCRTYRTDRATVNKMFLNNFQSRCRLVSISFSSFLLNCKWMATPCNNHLINLNIEKIKIWSSVQGSVACLSGHGPRIWNGQKSWARTKHCYFRFVT